MDCVKKGKCILHTNKIKMRYKNIQVNTSAGCIYRKNSSVVNRTQGAAHVIKYKRSGKPCAWDAHETYEQDLNKSVHMSQ